jgi:methionyl-tRNA synthetase
MEYISIDEFSKVDARFGKILEAEEISGSEKLIKFKIDFGLFGIKQILSGIKKWYPDIDELVGQTIMFCVNLEPREMMGYKSEGMLMAVDGISGKPIFLKPSGEIELGAKIH